MWAVDIDKIDGYSLEDIEVLVTNKINGCFPIGEKVIEVVPIETGIRFITEPFYIGDFDFKFVKVNPIIYN